MRGAMMVHGEVHGRVYEQYILMAEPELLYDEYVWRRKSDNEEKFNYVSK